MQSQPQGPRRDSWSLGTAALLSGGQSSRRRLRFPDGAQGPVVYVCDPGDYSACTGQCGSLPCARR